MNVIRPICRNRFTAADVEFIASALARGGSDSGLVADLLTDPGARDLMLDRRELVDAILEGLGCLSISPRLYFYVLVRHALREAGIDDREMADYIAELLSVFTSSHRSRNPLPDQALPLDYFVDMVEALSEADDVNRFLLRAHVGNYALFLLGLFPGYIRSRRDRRAAPGARYYESLGSASYRIAGGHHLAERYELRPVFHGLSDRFHTARMALNDLADRLVWLEDRDPDGWRAGVKG